MGAAARSPAGRRLPASPPPLFSRIPPLPLAPPEAATTTTTTTRLLASLCCGWRRDIKRWRARSARPVRPCDRRGQRVMGDLSGVFGACRRGARYGYWSARATERQSVSTPKTNLFGLTKRLGEEGVGKGKGLCVYFGQGQTLSIATCQQQVAAPLSIVQARSIPQLEMDFEASCMGCSGSERIRR
jgi:hypothetical protein